MTTKHADSNYQALAAQFRVHDLVVPYGASRDFAGRVVAVYPGIGMIEVQFPMGNKRYPVEDVQRLDSEGNPLGTTHDTVPGGLPTVSVSGGPVTAPSSPSAEPLSDSKKAAVPSASRVARAHVKQAIYWAEAGRRYKATRAEQSSGVYLCPGCKEEALQPVSYKRQDGKSVRLLGCPGCMFLIRPDDIVGCHLPGEADQVGG